jgi:hypothetical protein
MEIVYEETETRKIIGKYKNGIIEWLYWSLQSQYLSWVGVLKYCVRDLHIAEF